MLDLWDVGIKTPEDLTEALSQAPRETTEDRAASIRWAIEAMADRWGENEALSMLFSAAAGGGQLEIAKEKTAAYAADLEKWKSMCKTLALMIRNYGFDGVCDDPTCTEDVCKAIAQSLELEKGKP